VSDIEVTSSEVATLASEVDVRVRAGDDPASILELVTELAHKVSKVVLWAATPAA
jgi:hypothetical protein